MKWLLHYIQGTKSLGLFYFAQSYVTLTCYASNNWGVDQDDRRSTNGYVIFLGSSLILWLAKKQPTIARSSTNSEYKVVENATSELVWLKGLLIELGYPINIATLHCDNV